MAHAAFASTSSLLGAALLAGLCTGAAAQVDRVEVSGQRLADVARTDVIRACPAVQAQLAEALGVLVAQHAVEGQIRVDLRIQGSQVSDISTLGGPFVYRGPLRRAAHQLDCQDASRDKQLYRFVVIFANEPNRVPENMVSLAAPN